MIKDAIITEQNKYLNFYGCISNFDEKTINQTAISG